MDETKFQEGLTDLIFWGTRIERSAAKGLAIIVIGYFRIAGWIDTSQVITPDEFDDSQSRGTSG